MLGIGAGVLAVGALGAQGESVGGVLVLAGASVLLPAEERGAKGALAAASVALAVLGWIG